MQIPTWVMKLARDWAFNKSTDAAAAEIRQDDPAMIPALRKFREGASFLEIVKAYTAASENKDDDAVATGIEDFRAELETKPFNEVLAKLAGPIGAIRVPDGDGDPTNNISVGEVLGRIVDKVVAD